MKAMETTVKRIGYLPRKRVLEIIDEISQSESISRSKVVGILVEEALGARGIDNFGYINKQNFKKDTSQFLKDKKIDINEDEFVDDNGYTFTNNTSDQSISSSDIDLANKINLLKKSGLI